MFVFLFVYYLFPQLVPLRIKQYRQVQLIKYIVFIIILYTREMSLNKNLTLVLVAVVMTLAMWMVPENISTQSHQQRLLLTTFNTNPIRSANIAKFCGTSTRADLITDGDKQTSVAYKAQLASTFKVNGNTLFNKLTNSDSAGAITDIQEDITAFGIFVGFFAVGLVLLMMVWTCLLCCCCCPGCCPSKCCQKNQNEQYTKCELYWPSIALILLLLLIIITTAMGLSKASTFKKGLSDLTCSTSILMDDIVNGNVTADGKSFFIGISQLITEMGNLDTNMGTVSTQMGNLDTGLTTIVTNANTAKNNIQLVPTNAATDAKLNIQYSGPINTAYSAGKTQIGSIFNDILGASNNGGIIGGLYSAMSTIHSTLSGIKTNSNGFSTNSATFDAAISGINSNLGGFKNTVTDLDTSVGSALSILEAPRDMGSLVIQLFYGVALGVAVLALLGVVLMTFCDKYKCRYLMYFSCLILFFFALIGFLLAIIFSILVPLIYWSCDWLSISIGSAAGFNANFAGIMSDASTRSYISTCLTGGTGDLMAVVAPSSINDINNLKNALLNTNLFNSTTEVNTLNTAIANVTLTINDFKNGLTPDVTDADALAALIHVSRANNFDAACASIMADGWLLSNSNTSFTSCNVASPSNKDHTTCTSKALLQGNTAPCTGCLDTSLLLNNFYSADIQGALLTSLNLKYTAACSATFKTYLGNVWDNYYFYKVNKMVGIGGAGGSGATGGRWNTAKTSVDTVVTGFTTVNTTMTNVINALNTAVEGIVDPKFGLIAGLNCLIIGEGLELMVSSICVSNFNTLYITRLLMGISSFGILFALCCIVCSGVRHYKHSQRKDKISPNFMGGDKNSFQHTDAAFNRA